ncbi:hypothetical protein F5Y08DRAFT_109869 [Xylaria arbuscula]|nr:hypothetical protein F5Y08DRAFT_109869 [Xylaria arbuscula]
MAGTRFTVLLTTLTVALFATAARGATVKFMNKLATDSIMQEGTSFEVKWSWDGDASAVGALVLTTFMRDDKGSVMNNTIEDTLDLSKGSYPWTVKTMKGRRSLDWYYRMGINYDDGASWSSGRYFRIMSTAMSSSSTTSSPTSTSTSGTSPGNSKHPSNGAGASGISGGAIAGIVVGVGIIAALIGLVLYYRRRSRREMAPFTPLGDIGDGYRNGNGNGNGTPSSSTPDYKNGAGFGVPAPKYEPPPEELDTVNPPTLFELEGGPQGQEGHTPREV